MVMVWHAAAICGDDDGDDGIDVFLPIFSKWRAVAPFVV